MFWKLLGMFQGAVLFCLLLFLEVLSESEKRGHTVGLTSTKDPENVFKYVLETSGVTQS